LAYLSLLTSFSHIPFSAWQFGFQTALDAIIGYIVQYPQAQITYLAACLPRYPANSTHPPKPDHHSTSITESASAAPHHPSSAGYLGPVLRQTPQQADPKRKKLQSRDRPATLPHYSSISTEAFSLSFVGTPGCVPRPGQSSHRSAGRVLVPPGGQQKTGALTNSFCFVCFSAGGPVDQIR